MGTIYASGGCKILYWVGKGLRPKVDCKGYFKFVCSGSEYNILQGSVLTKLAYHVVLMCALPWLILHFNSWLRESMRSDHTVARIAHEV